MPAGKTGVCQNISVFQQADLSKKPDENLEGNLVQHPYLINMEKVSQVCIPNDDFLYSAEQLMIGYISSDKDISKRLLVVNPIIQLCKF